MTSVDLLIVGTGHAGAQAAITLRQLGFTGSLAMVGEETGWPYERPPLSKDYLAGTRDADQLLIRPSAFWAEREIQLLGGRRVVAVDAGARSVTCADGSMIGYGALIWAGGGAARRLGCGGADLAGVHSIRSQADVDRLRAELPSVQRVVVVGGGYIGLEAASVLVRQGKQVTIVEALDRVLARVAAEPLSRFFEAEHRAQGVDVQLSATVAAIEGEDGKATAVRLANGSTLPADLVIVGIGIVPEVAPLIAAGAAGDNGVLVDAQCRTSLPDAFAIGDCALHINRFAGGASVRLESVQNAHDQAQVAARTILGQPAENDSVPWFWSNQYALKLQTVGLSLGHDELLVRGELDARSFSIIYRRAGKVIALDCVNAVGDYVAGRKLVLGESIVPAERLVDTSAPLKALFA